MFVDSHATITARENRDKQQIAEMEKAAKAAFSFCRALRKSASRYVIIAPE
ncbi:hypothetical protein Y59_11540 [Enterobacter hormaechei]|nr:hypothetical protein Y59_11540 [Enterobacter hormaechei]